MQKALTNIALAFVAIAVVQTMCNFNPPSTATTTVFVYQDLNNNGEFDQGEPPFPDVTVNPGGVTDQDGNLVYQKTFTNTRECIGVSEVGVTVPEGYSLSQSQIEELKCNYVGVLSDKNIERKAVFGLAPTEVQQESTAPQGDEPEQVQPELTTAPETSETPGLSMSMSADPTSFSRPRQRLNFTYTFTNTGDVELTGPFDINDNMADPGSIKCDQDPASAVIAPGESVTCTSSYLTTADDTSSVVDQVTVSVSTQSGQIQAQALAVVEYVSKPEGKGEPTEPPVEETEEPEE